jgi:hypothetical protein
MKSVGSPSLAGPVLTLALSIPFQAVLWAAAFRAFLRPAEAKFAYLRVGRAELRLAGLVLLSSLAGILALTLPLASISFMSNGAFQFLIVDHWFSYFVSNLYPLLVTLALVRFILTPAIMIDQDRVSLMDSWRLTHSSFWSLAMPLLAWQVIRMVLGRLVGLIIHFASDIAMTTSAFPRWMPIPSLALMVTGAVLESLSIVVIAGIATTAYGYVTASAERSDGRSSLLKA